MSNPPVGKRVYCSQCDEVNVAIIPQGGKIVEQEKDAAGKVWVDCRSCGNRFITYYLIE